MPAEAILVESGPTEDLAKSVLDAYEGDAIAALRSVIADAEFLHDQLHIARQVMGHGYTRQWMPSCNRDA